MDRNTLFRGSKTTFRVIEEFKVDAALLRSARRLEELAAREMGQWGNDHEHATVGLQNEPFQSTVADAARKLTPEQVEAEVERILAKGKSQRRSFRETGDAPNNVPMSAAK